MFTLKNLAHKGLTRKLYSLAPSRLGHINALVQQKCNSSAKEIETSLLHDRCVIVIDGLLQDSL